MKYKHQPAVNPQIAAKSVNDIESVNAYIDNLKGTIISIERIRSGQQGAYGDSIEEALIFAYQPNVLTTNSPLARTLTRDQAATLTKMFIGTWKDNPEFLDTRLEKLEPEHNPCSLREYVSQKVGEVRSCCWHVILRTPYND